MNKPNKSKHTSMQKERVLSASIFLVPSLVLCIIFMVIPLINVIRYSFTDWDGMSLDYNFVGLQNYLHLHEMEGFSEMLIATFGFAIGLTFLTIIISLITALSLDKKRKGLLPRNLIRSIWFFPSLLSGAVVGILWKIMYNYHNGVINNIVTFFGKSPVNWLETRGVANIAIIVAATWVQIGFCIVVFLAGLQSVPQELYEAAAIDGATPFQQRRYVTLPLMAQSITINVITTTIAGFKLYELPFMITNGKPGYSTMLITSRIKFYGFDAYDYGRGSALSVFLLIIIALISLLQLFYFRSKEENY